MKIDFRFWNEVLLAFVVGLLILPLKVFIMAFNYVVELGSDTIADYRMDKKLKKIFEEEIK